MKRAKILLLLLTLVLAVVGTVVWFAPSASECHKGRHLSEWLSDLVATNGEPHAVAAVQSIGTNAVPFLLKGLTYSYSRRREVFYSTVDRVFHRTLHLTAKPIYDPAQIRPIQAFLGFEALGAAASNAVPPLANMLGSQHGDAAAIALSRIGSTAVPALIEALGNRSPAVRYDALNGLAQLGTNSGPALSAVVDCLDDTNVVRGGAVRVVAIIALGKMRGEAMRAVPALTRLAEDLNPGVRALAAQSLHDIELERERREPELRKMQ